jgi:hypothetical protein
MKMKSTEVAVALTMVLCVALFMLSCNTAPQNPNTNQYQNQNQNQNQNQSLIGAQPAGLLEKDASCDEVNIDNRLRKAQERIDQDLANDNQLKDGRVKVQVKKVASTMYLEALVEGQALGEDELQDLSRILRKFMQKKCVLRVSFVPTGTIPIVTPSGTPTTSTTSSIPGIPFAWSACEYPKVPCPDGECKDSCDTESPGNGNTNSSPNSNTASNSNRSVKP